MSDLKTASPLSLPRSYFFELTDPTVSATLCGFCDASTKAYAAVVYLILKTETRSSVQFVAAKTRVAPLKSQTIPRLELLSALLLANLIVSVHSSLQHQIPSLSIKCFTDFQVALYWILGSDKEWKPFVQNRVAEIRRKVHPNHWYHCPGTNNPADLPSRGITMMELSVSQLWRSRPEWQKDYDTLKKQLRLFRDEKGLWRCGGRLQNVDLPFAAKHPILLPRSHHYTGLVVRDAHIRVCHNGVKETLTEVRSRYWVIKGRSLTRSLVHRCTTCRR